MRIHRIQLRPDCGLKFVAPPNATVDERAQFAGRPMTRFQAPRFNILFDADLRVVTIGYAGQVAVLPMESVAWMNFDDATAQAATAPEPAPAKSIDELVAEINAQTASAATQAAVTGPPPSAEEPPQPSPPPKPRVKPLVRVRPSPNGGG